MSDAGKPQVLYFGDAMEHAEKEGVIRMLRTQLQQTEAQLTACRRRAEAAEDRALADDRAGQAGRAVVFALLRPRSEGLVTVDDDFRQARQERLSKTSSRPGWRHGRMMMIG